jgi:hypothetical protein
VDAALTPSAPDLKYFPGYAEYLWTLSGPLRNHILLGAGLAGGFLTLRSKTARQVGLWGLLLGMLSLPYGISLGPFRPDLMLIVLFLPAALLIGDLVVSVGDWSGRWLRVPIGQAFWVTLIIGACCWGAVQTGDILNPSTVFADRDDLAAIQWIRENTPSATRFFVNDTPWQSATYRGVDGGWWILPLTGRQTLLPPVAYAWGTRDYINQINGWAKRASQVSGCTPEFWSLVQDGQLDYAYLHAGMGSLQPEKLTGCAGAEVVYHSGTVWIFHLTTLPNAGN